MLFYHDQLRPFCHLGLLQYVVKEDGKWQIVDQIGDIYLKGKFDEVIGINAQNIIIKKDNRYGVVELNGDTKIETKYQEITYAFDNNYIFKENNKYGIINLEKEIVLKQNFLIHLFSLLYSFSIGYVGISITNFEFSAISFTIFNAGRNEGIDLIYI